MEETEIVAQDSEIPSTSTADNSQSTVTAAETPGTPGTVDLDPVHIEIQDPVTWRSNVYALTRWKRFRLILHNSTLPKPHEQWFYYGGEANLERERARQEASGVWVIHPHSTLRFYYVLFMVVITFENLISVPIEMVFHEQEQNAIQLGFSIFCEVIFLIDIGLNFRMGILKKDCVGAILDLHTIKTTYLKSWFIPDLLSAFPIDIILLISESLETPLAAGKIMRILMFVRLISMVRLLRVSRLVNFFSEIETVSEAHLEWAHKFHIIPISIVILLASHWSGVLQYFVALVMEFPEESWVHKENLLNGTFTEKYAFAVFRVVSSVSRLGGSTDSLASNVEMWMSMVNAMFTVSVFFILAHSFSSMMNETPASICTNKDIFKMIYGTLLTKMPTFKGRDANFIKAVLPTLMYKVCLEDDVIFRQDDPEDQMFFIVKGHVSVEMDCYQWELCDGDYFGEMCLLEQGVRASTARALSTCQLLSLSVDCLQQVLLSYPEVREQIEMTAVPRQEDLRLAELRNTTEEDE